MNQNTMNQNNFEIETNKINFTCLWRITDINVDTVTFTKHEINLNQSIINPINTSVSLRNIIGSEIHRVSPEIQLQLCGRVGEIIKGFESSKISRTIKVTKIIYL